MVHTSWTAIGLVTTGACPVTLLYAALALLVACASTVQAQSFPFEWTFPATGDVHVDVSTERGKIAIRAGKPGQIVVTGTASVRVGWNVPADAIELARAVAAHPPIAQQPDGVQVRPPSDERTRQATTVAYELRVPPDARVTAASDSGAIAIAGAGRTVTVRTQSGAIDLEDLPGTLDVTSGSGAVALRGVRGGVRAATSSSAITAHDLGAGFHARTGSGAIEASFTGPADAASDTNAAADPDTTTDVDVQTDSSSIVLTGVDGALLVSTGSGRVRVTGTPRRDWTISSRSSALDVQLTPAARATLEASSRSGSVTVADGLVSGSVEKRRVTGTIQGGGATVTLTSGSGAIHVTQATP